VNFRLSADGVDLSAFSSRLMIDFYVYFYSILLAPNCKLETANCKLQCASPNLEEAHSREGIRWIARAVRLLPHVVIDFVTAFII
jgi:hypothetical protein